MIKRINLFSGPGCGKSTTAAAIYIELKRLGYSVELVDETIKGRAWQKKELEGYEYIKLFGKQVDREDVVLRSGGIVVTSGPLLHAVIYAKLINSKCADALHIISQEFEKTYPSLNLYLSRDFKYQPDSRFHNESEAKHMDTVIANFLVNNSVNFTYCSPIKFDKLMEIVLPKLTKQG